MLCPARWTQNYRRKSRDNKRPLALLLRTVLLSLLSHLLSHVSVTKVLSKIATDNLKNAAFFSAGTFVTCVTDIREWRGGVTLLMDIYSIVNLEPCDTVTEVTEV